MIVPLNPGSVEVKAEALLSAGLVEVVCVDDTHTVVDVCSTTSNAVHRVRCDGGGGWVCSCPAGQHQRRCSHVAASQRVAAAPGLRRLKPHETS